MNLSNESLQSSLVHDEGWNQADVLSALDNATRAVQEADAANDLLLKAESLALIGKIYFKFMTKTDKAEQYYKLFMADVSGLIGNNNSLASEGWYTEAMEF